nr:protein 70 [synthetic construct]
MSLVPRLLAEAAVVFNTSVAPGRPGGRGPQNPSVPLGNGWVGVPEELCYCKGWYNLKGSDSQASFADIMQWVVFVLCMLVVVWNAINFFYYSRQTTSWECVFVMTIVCAFYGFSIWHQFDSPVIAYFSTGNISVLLRYGQWLFCTPVLLVAVSDMTGRNGSYSREHMLMIMADVFAVTIYVGTAVSPNFWVKFFCTAFSTIAFMYLFFMANRCYKKLLDDVPTARCRSLVQLIRVVFFVGWNMHTCSSLANPEVLNFLNALEYQITACFGDLVAKVLFCALATYLRVLMHHDAPPEEEDDAIGPNQIAMDDACEGGYEGAARAAAA